MHWVDGQLLVRRLPDNGGCYILKQLYCELCKFPYTANIYKNVLIKRPQTAHLILEELENSQVTKIHVIPTTNKKHLTIGRSKDCDIWLADISVSRRHARLTLSEESMKIEDTGSKFGTLVLLQKGIELNTDKQATQVQVGNSLVTIKVSTVSRIASFFIPRRFQPEIGLIRVVGNREPSRKVLEREVERRQRAASLRADLSLPLTALPVPSVAIPPSIDGVVEEFDMPHHEDDFSTVFRGSPTHARGDLIEEVDDSHHV
jgi:hypothetical protein